MSATEYSYSLTKDVCRKGQDMLIFITITIVSLFLLSSFGAFWLSKGFFVTKSHQNIFVCFCIVVLFSAYTFTNLGSFHSPSSYFVGGDQVVYIDLGEGVQVRRVQFMTYLFDGEVFQIEFSYDGLLWQYLHVETTGAFAWEYRDVIVLARYIRIVPVSDTLYLLEMGFRDYTNALVPIAFVDHFGAALFDEQYLVPAHARDYTHSMYFDEIFYARAGYELVNRLAINEQTHPDLAKIIISLGINLFGMVPFGWRFMSALVGVIVLIPLYYLAYALFKSSFWAGFVTFLFAFDFMHFTSSRIAMTDVFVVFFIVCMYFFMYRYSQLNFFEKGLFKTLAPLFFSGLFMGFAVSTKWSGLFGAIGIAVIFFMSLAKRYNQYKTDTAQYKNFHKYTAITLACCVLFFVVMPITIYVLTHIPRRATGYMYPELGFFAAITQTQIDKFRFHMFLDADHYFSSHWWHWVINSRPVMYFANMPSYGVVQNIASFGNPAVWWSGIGAFFYTGYSAFAKKDYVPKFLLIGYLSLLVPWFFFGRTSFIWYYYPNVVFLVLMIGYTIKEAKIFDTLKTNRYLFACGFATAVFVLFGLFYPVITGVPISAQYVARFLLWPFMTDWVFVAL